MSTLQRNKAQEDAINTIYGPVMIVSCPGSGKTTTLIRRIHHMLEEGIAPSSILMVTFSTEAARSMQKKYESMYGTNPGVTFSTIHAFCYNIMLRHGDYKRENLLLDADSHRFIEERLNVPYGTDRFEIASAAKTAIGVVKNNHLDPSSYKDCEGIDPDTFLSIYRAYEDYKQRYGYYDFDDMLTICYDIFHEQPDVLRMYQNRFQYIQCDEYQDVNETQRDLLYLLAGSNENLCVVGDDDQSIYAFRGSRPEIMMNFSSDYPNAAIINMGINYRSGSEVVKFAGTLIEKNKKRIGKDFRSFRGENGFAGKVDRLFFARGAEEYRGIVRKITELHENGVPYASIAILFRTNEGMTGPAGALSDAGIPYYSTETVRTMYDSVYFQDFRHYMALAAGTGSEKDFFAILNHPARYLRAADFAGVPYDTQAMLETALRSCSQSWQYDRMSDTIWNWMEAFGPGKIAYTDPPEKLIRALRMIHYPSDFLKQYAKFRNFKEADVFDEYDELIADAKGFDTIGEWFDYADRTIQKIQNDVKKKDRTGVMLTTMHKSKGLEWPVVIIPDANEGVTPHKKSMSKYAALEEERRLFYVAMTRAMNELYIFALNMKSSHYLVEMEQEEKPSGRPVDAAPVKKKLAGAKVMHKKYGEGSVVSYAPGKVRIKFGDTMKDFPFPDAFQKGFLQYI